VFLVSGGGAAAPAAAPPPEYSYEMMNMSERRERDGTEREKNEEGKRNFLQVNDFSVRKQMYMPF
jgi:hypothetical protein